jgi:aspartate/methionine/tyrosine aminotransferase
VATRAYWETVIGLAGKHDFKVFSDECYSEIYRDTPPVGALSVADAMGADPDRVLLFNSLSKRSNMPGLRSGFVAGGAESIARMKTLRAYAGAPLPLPLQAVATRAWADETHVEDNRALYRAKYAIADAVLGDIPGFAPPEAGFFLWLPVADGEQAAVRLWQETGVMVLPGAYLARETGGLTPGQDRIRVAMVAPADDVRAGLERLKACLYG